MTVAALRAELEWRGQATDGKKAVLAARLEATRGCSRPGSAAANESAAASSVVVEEMSLDDYEAARAEAKPAGAPPKKRMSVDAKDLSIPVLQGKLRLALGQSAKLPKKKPELLALYMRHCDE